MSENWDGDEDDSDGATEDDELERQVSEFEKEYLAVKKKVQKEIEQHLKEASAALNKAVLLSEKHGIILDSNISPIFQSYKPFSFEKTWSKKFTSEVLDNLEDLYIPEEEGWEHSDVC